MLFRRILDEVNVAVVATDLDFRFEYWNKGAERFYGWTANDAIGRTTIELLLPEVPEQHVPLPRPGRAPRRGVRPHP